MNSGCNEEELKPYVEPEHCMDDPRRIEQLVAHGYARADIEDSLRLCKFDDIYATYLLMNRRAADVSVKRSGSGRFSVRVTCSLVSVVVVRFVRSFRSFFFQAWDRYACNFDTSAILIPASY